MANEPSDMEGTDSARFALDQSEKATRDLFDALDILRARVKADETVSHAEVQKTLTALAALRGKLLDEVTKYEDRVLLAEKRRADSVVDFDALRSEIGRKLDRLRASRDAG